MLLGTHLVNCISDIIEGHIDYHDVFAIISQNQFDISCSLDIHEWYTTAIHQYSITGSEKNKLHKHTEKDVKGLFNELVHYGVIVNRPHAGAFHIASLRLDPSKHWYYLASRTDDMSPAVKDAYDQYRLIENLIKK